MHVRVYSNPKSGGAEAGRVYGAEDEEAPGLRGGRSEWAYEMIAEAIREGTIEPGQRIMEVETSNWLRISRTPVRDALRRLQAEGMLEPAAGGGLAVALHGMRSIAEFYAVRESLEGTAAGLAAANADAADVRILQASLEVMRDAPDDPAAHARLNAAFHARILQAAHNRFLTKSLQQLLNFVPLLGRTTYHAPGRIEAAQVEHAAIVDAIAARDAGGAEAQARAHIRTAAQARVEMVTEEVMDAAHRRPAASPPRRKPGPPKPARTDPGENG